MVDCSDLEDRHIREITIGFYAAGSSQETQQHFTLNIGQIKVRWIKVRRGGLYMTTLYRSLVYFSVLKNFGFITNSVKFPIL